MDVKELWHNLGGQFVDVYRLKLLTDDKGVMHMLNIARLNHEVHLYVVHNIMKPEIIEMTDWGGHGEVQTEMLKGEGDEGEGDGEVHTELGTQVVEGEGDAHEGVEEAKVHVVHDFELEDLGEDDDVEGNEGEDVYEAEIEDEDVDDEEVDVSVQCDTDTSKGSLRQEPSSLVVESSRSTDNVCIHDVRGLSDNEWLSDELISGVDSEDDDGSTKIRFPTFIMPKSLEAYKWEVGTYFAKKKEFTDAIRTYALSNGRSLQFIRMTRKGFL
ncbi:hypothetical protein V8G54_027157 [Vigna mungo]|uniref:Transposase MuDR plant domain-containing protein n=1 Tax=Vigna mungo TaxID=3915 RepID=A0AAQ3N0V6_VIGMU